MLRLKQRRADVVALSEQPIARETVRGQVDDAHDVSLLTEFWQELIFHIHLKDCWLALQRTISLLQSPPA